MIYMKGNLKMIEDKDMVDIFGREDNPMRESLIIIQLKEMEYFFILLEFDIKDNWRTVKKKDSVLVMFYAPCKCEQLIECKTRFLN